LIFNWNPEYTMLIDTEV